MIPLVHHEERILSNGLVDGRQIRAARAALGLSQAEFADGAGVNRNTVYRAEGLASIPGHCRTGDKIERAFADLGISFAAHDRHAVVAFSTAPASGLSK